LRTREAATNALRGLFAASMHALAASGVCLLVLSVLAWAYRALGHPLCSRPGFLLENTVATITAVMFICIGFFSSEGKGEGCFCAPLTGYALAVVLYVYGLAWIADALRVWWDWIAGHFGG